MWGVSSTCPHSKLTLLRTHIRPLTRTTEDNTDNTTSHCKTVQQAGPVSIASSKYNRSSPPITEQLHHLTLGEQPSCEGTPGDIHLSSVQRRVETLWMDTRGHPSVLSAETSGDTLDGHQGTSICPQCRDEGRRSGWTPGDIHLSSLQRRVETLWMDTRGHPSVLIAETSGDALDGHQGTSICPRCQSLLTDVERCGETGSESCQSAADWSAQRAVLSHVKNFVSDSV
ncbi:unnamed protein product [Pleuronectes platessa]|uniref:Uncharacterized protein n=1 Tax=Pleuronectes platessa TaxID=8262 RepID=A0A9N7Y3E3_PLEPL|nr:unnamed protein product [Pleuronectes platessa]